MRRRPVVGLWLVAVVFGAMAHGEPAAAPLGASGSRDGRSGIIKEVGVCLGTPAGINLSLGTWGTDGVPILARLSGMYLGKSLRGIQAELGWAFDQEGPVRQYIALGYLNGKASSLDAIEWEGFGPMYGFRWRGFAASLGFTFGHGRYIPFLGAAQPLDRQATGQIGYAFHW